MPNHSSQANTKEAAKDFKQAGKARKNFILILSTSTGYHACLSEGTKSFSADGNANTVTLKESLAVLSNYSTFRQGTIIHVAL